MTEKQTIDEVEQDEIIRYSATCAVCGGSLALITPKSLDDRLMPCIRCGYRLSHPAKLEVLCESGKWLELELTD